MNVVLANCRVNSLAEHFKLAKHSLRDAVLL